MENMTIVDKRGSWFSFEDKQLGQGREQSKEAIKNYPALEARILAKIKAEMADDIEEEDEKDKEKEKEKEVKVS